jgi:hypothetical protein
MMAHLSAGYKGTLYTHDVSMCMLAPSISQGSNGNNGIHEWQPSQK